MFGSLALTAILAGSGVSAQFRGNNVWAGHSGDPQHTGISFRASQDIIKKRWSTPVDLVPRYSGNSLLTHYGVPVVTRGNILITPVKQNLTDGFKVRAFNAFNGEPVWTADTDYSLPPSSWLPSMSPTLLSQRSNVFDPGVAFQAGGGRVSFRAAHAKTATVTTRAFYGDAIFNANAANMRSNVKICTPLTACPDGSVLFGYIVLGTNAANLSSGVARVKADGTGSWVSAATLSGDSAVAQVKTNCAPAITADGSSFYITVHTANFGRGILVRANLSNYAVTGRVALKDPKTGNDAAIDSSGTASPTIGTDGDVYIGVLENPFPHNGYRGWLLHFNKDLTVKKTPGAFGWDDTPSLVPSFMVPDYAGGSPYLLFVKYNNYAVGGGQGLNRLAVIDPQNAEIDARSGQMTMKVIRSILNPTSDHEYSGTYPSAVREWCVNSAVVDVQKQSILVTGEDGILYRWSLPTNKFSQSLQLTPGIGEAYTPTAVAADGTIIAIANAVLYAVGK